MEWSKKFFGTYGAAQIVAAVHHSRLKVAATWSPPHGDTLKINVDAAFPGSSNGLWVSMGARNSEGVYLVESEEHHGTPQGQWISRSTSNLPWVARGHGWKSVVLESDCLQVIIFFLGSL